MDKEKILIVDDDENIAELISLYLNKEYDRLFELTRDCLESKQLIEHLQSDDVD